MNGFGVILALAENDAETAATPHKQLDDRGRFRRALRDPVAIGQVDAGVHRQDDLCPNASEDRIGLAGYHSCDFPVQP